MKHDNISLIMRTLGCVPNFVIYFRMGSSKASQSDMMLGVKVIFNSFTAFSKK